MRNWVSRARSLRRWIRCCELNGNPKDAEKELILQDGAPQFAIYIGTNNNYYYCYNYNG